MQKISLTLEGLNPTDKRSSVESCYNSLQEAFLNKSETLVTLHFLKAVSVQRGYSPSDKNPSHMYTAGSLLRAACLDREAQVCDYIVMPINFPGYVFVSQFRRGSHLCFCALRRRTLVGTCHGHYYGDICFRCESIKRTRDVCGLWALAVKLRSALVTSRYASFRGLFREQYGLY